MSIYEPLSDAHIVRNRCPTSNASFNRRRRHRSQSTACRFSVLTRRHRRCSTADIRGSHETLPNGLRSTTITKALSTDGGALEVGILGGIWLRQPLTERTSSRRCHLLTVNAINWSRSVVVRWRRHCFNRLHSLSSWDEKLRKTPFLSEIRAH